MRRELQYFNNSVVNGRPCIVGVFDEVHAWQDPRMSCTAMEYYYPSTVYDVNGEENTQHEHTPNLTELQAKYRVMREAYDRANEGRAYQLAKVTELAQEVAHLTQRKGELEKHLDECQERERRLSAHVTRVEKDYRVYAEICTKLRRRLAKVTGMMRFVAENSEKFLKEIE